jgi:hypothetical protein
MWQEPTRCTLFYECFNGVFDTFRGTRWRTGWGTALQTGRSWVRFPMVSLEFFIDIILPVALWPWGRHSLQQKWVPEIFTGVKGGRCVGLTILPPSCADCLKIWVPQPPRTHRACQGIALPLYTIRGAVNKFPDWWRKTQKTYLRH